MSYYISANGPTKSAVREQLARQYEERVLVPQPQHAKDRTLAMTTLENSLAVLTDPPAGFLVHANLSGSIGTNLGGEVAHTNISCTAYLVPEPVRA